MSKGRIVTLSVTPTDAPVQLVLALDGVGIRRAKRRRRKGRHPWMPAPKAVAA